MITVLRVPPFATVQDLGRPGHLEAAVPRAGALDPLALAAANLAVGNPRSAAALEWALGGGEVRFERGASVALTGAQVTGTLGGRALEPLRVVRAKPGDSLVVEQLDRGAWLYIAISGGIDVPPVLGSRSTYLPGGFGGLSGRVLRSGDRLPLGTEATQARLEILPAELGADTSSNPIRLLPGPDRDLIPPGAWDDLVRAEYRVSRVVSRMGYRLEAGWSGLALAGDRPSAPACIGTLQLPAGGKPIVLLGDGPTVGGYARIGAVVTADLGYFAQRRPGDSVRFRPVELTEARQALREQQALLDRLERGA
jgi:biotin-dependent carboxylase-like uncharacterized protein